MFAGEHLAHGLKSFRHFALECDFSLPQVLILGTVLVCRNYAIRQHSLQREPDLFSCIVNYDAYSAGIV